tara:strand:- start:163 stop:369 length:207 start_codon:yes stop_codon:yes gene_type:complete
MLLIHYKSKKELKSNIGKKLKYTETSIFGPEYKANGVIYAARRSHIEGFGHEFFAEITMKNGLIVKVK